MAPKCFHCNGYYGSSYGQPVCSTCHMFLYADESSSEAANAHHHNKVEDGDSGNEEPREASEGANPCASSMTDFPVNESTDELMVEHTTPFKLGCKEDKKVPNLNESFENKPKDSPPKFTSHTEDLGAEDEYLTDTEDEDYSKIPIGTNITKIPPEVLLVIFEKLDDVSLWSVSQVCSSWNQLVRFSLNNEWKVYTNRRWPLFSPLFSVSNWHKVFTSLIESAPCQLCFLQIPYDSMLVMPADHESSWRRNRLVGELRTIRSDPPEGIAASPLDTMSLHWQASIRGPAGSPYQGGTFFLYIRIPPTYPLRPPLVRFTTKIFHPNVSRHGDIGIDSIQHNWSLALTISKILISIQSLLTDPYTKICMEPRIGDIYDNNRSQFDRIARAWTWRYAMHDAIDPDTMIADYLQHLTSDHKPHSRSALPEAVCQG